MKKFLAPVAIVCLSLSTVTHAVSYGKHLCAKSDEYTCVKIKKGDNWAKLFPNEEQRIIVKKANRMNTPLHNGMVIAVPKNLSSIKVLDIAPFPHKIEGTGHNTVKVNLEKLAWGAYDAKGDLLNWGPVSGGKDYCPDIHHGCKTPKGTFSVYRKQGEGCISSKFPRPHGGAHMPYCMHFQGGYAMHGSAVVPGSNASHGCVRMFTEDAKWLNQDFVNIGSKVVIQ